MNPQQLHDYIIKTTLEYMGGNYYSKESAFLLLATAAIESNCGEYIKQINGPALGIWQMEPDTHDDIWQNCDALRNIIFEQKIYDIFGKYGDDVLIKSPMYACAMARLKYSMDPHALPEYTGDSEVDLPVFYEYYKRVYNTELGASTYQKWCNAIAANHILKVNL
jgi:hypothetical protein